MLSKLKNRIANAKYRRLGLPLVGLIGVGLIIAVSVTVLFNSVYGWFTQNKLVSGNGMTVRAMHKEPEVTVFRAENDAFNNLGTLRTGDPIDLVLDIPNSTQLLLLKVDSAYDGSVTINSISFPAPTDALEKPVSVTENSVTNYYWFSTQLAVQAVYIGSTQPTVAQAEAAFGNIADSDMLAASTINGANASARPTNFTMFTRASENTTASSGTSVYFAVRVTFVNRNEDQNVYKNFGAEGDPCCKRVFSFTFE